LEANRQTARHADRLAKRMKSRRRRRRCRRLCGNKNVACDVDAPFVSRSLRVASRD